MKKNEFIVRDSLPDTPDSFYSEVERSLSACCDKKEERSWSLKRLPRRLLIPMVAAATLLIATTAVAAGMLFRSSYSPGNYLNDPKESREEHGQAIPDVEAAIASAAPETGDYTITMLPEFDNAEEMDGWRVKLGQPKYDEAAWGWMRKIRPEIREVLYDGRNCTFTMRLHTDHGLSFNWPREDEGQWVEALVDDAWFRMEGEEKTHSVLASGGIQSFDETGATLLGEIDKEAPFPQEGRVELTIVVGLRDARVDDMATIGIVGRIFYTFSFDVAAAREASAPVVTFRPLSGSIVLTVDDGITDPDHPKLYNQRVSLDGVVLREEVVYRQTGIYVTYTVEKAPAGWTEAMKNSLLYPNREGQWHGLYLDYRLGREGEWLPVCYESHGNFGERTVILPIFPSDYEQVKKDGCILRLAEYYTITFNFAPVDEDWRYDIPAGASSMQMDLQAQELGAFEIPLP